MTMSLLERLFRFLRRHTRPGKKDEVHPLHDGCYQILYLPVRITEQARSGVKKPAQGYVHVRLDGLPWKQVRSLDPCGPNEPVFVLNKEEGCIVFGDGLHGRRPPAGIKTILSSYRTGAGSPGDGSSGSGADTGSYSFLAYLDVWTREVTAFEEKSFCELALGGPDTTPRSDP
jgi:hypothetical protein